MYHIDTTCTPHTYTLFLISHPQNICKVISRTTKSPRHPRHPHICRLALSKYPRTPNITIIIHFRTTTTVQFPAATQALQVKKSPPTQANNLIFLKMCSRADLPLDDGISIKSDITYLVIRQVQKSMNKSWSHSPCMMGI